MIIPKKTPAYVMGGGAGHANFKSEKGTISSSPAPSFLQRVYNVIKLKMCKHFKTAMTGNSTS